MKRQPIPLFSPKTNEWEKGTKYPPLDPDSPEHIPEGGAGPEVRRVLRVQRRDGLWDWSGLPAPTAPFAEFNRQDCIAVARDEMRRSFGASAVDRLAATIAVLAVLSRAYERHIEAWRDARDRAISAVTRQTGADERELWNVVGSVCASLRQRWIDRRAARRPLPVAKTKSAMERERQVDVRLRAARKHGFPIQQYRHEKYVRVDGTWIDPRDERPVTAVLAAELERLWAHRQRK